jgi:hypothetical protein
MGVFLIRNTLKDKVLVATGLDLSGAVNRHKFQLTMGTHRNTELQRDWDELGSDKFSFEIVDEISPIQDADLDYRKELAALEKLWLEKLEPYGDRGYIQRTPGREEMLSRIAANRRGEF